MKDIVIMVGAAYGSVLSLVHSIKKEINCKAFILCIDFKTLKILSSSKVIDEVFFIKNKSETFFIESIKKWSKKKKFIEKPILYFTYDTACFYINKHRNWFVEHFILCIPSSEIIQIFTQKGLAERKAEEAGLTVPNTTIIENNDEIEKVSESFFFPVIVKPRANYLRQNIDFKIKILYNEEEFVTFVSPIIKNRVSLLCQEYIQGCDEDVYYYMFYRANDGRIYENMGRKLLQSPPGGGIMAKGIVEYNETLAMICRDFLEKINYKGIGGIEFKKYNNQFFFIEMSTRLEGFYKISEISGSPLSLASYYDIINDRAKLDVLYLQKQRDNLVYIDFLPTIIARVRSRKFFSLCADIFSIFFCRKVKLNIFSKKDLKPFLLSLRFVLKWI